VGGEVGLECKVNHSLSTTACVVGIYIAITSYPEVQGNIPGPDVLYVTFQHQQEFTNKNLTNKT